MPRHLRLILAGLFLVFTNVVVPAHTRGLVTLPGGGSPGCRIDASPADSQQAGCCTSEGGVPSPEPGAPTEEQRERCAVCYIAAALIAPPPFVIDFEPREHVAERVRTVLAQFSSTQFALPYFPLGPPIL